MKRTILRIPAVKFESGLSRSTIYQRIAEGLWTKPVSLGARAVGWPSDEVEAINSARIAGKTDEEIRTLVVKLEQTQRVDRHARRPEQRRSPSSPRRRKHSAP